MQLNIFTKAALEQLTSDMYLNTKKYLCEEEWLENYFRDQSVDRYCRDTGIAVPDFELLQGGPENDAANARTIYEKMKGSINPRMASDLRLWGLLAHREFYSYMVNRWTSHKYSDAYDDIEGGATIDREYGAIKDRFFFGASNGKAFVRQGIARLYWGAYLTYDERNGSDPYELTDYIFSKQDLFGAATERLLGRNKTFLLASLKTLKQTGDISRQDIRDYYAAINRTCGIEILESLSEERALELCKKCLDDVMSLPKVRKDSKVKVRYIDSGKDMLIIANSKGATIGKSSVRTSPQSIIGYRPGKRFSVGDKKVKVIAID